MPEPETNAPKPRITVKTISVQYGRKINLGDYQSATLEATIWADIDPEVDEREALKALFATAKATVKEQAMPLLKAEPTSLNMRETFLGTPVESEKV